MVVLVSGARTIVPTASTPRHAVYIVGYVINAIAKCLDAMGSIFHFLSRLLTELLPAVLAPARLNALTRTRYDKWHFNTEARVALGVGLLSWESELLDHYNIRSGRMLVLGAGCGRETIALARRGLAVIGVEINDNAIHAASRMARQTGVQARFHRADFLRLPYKTASFDYLLLSSIMYSAIPGRSLRQVWLWNMLRVLSPGGLAILSFEARHHPRSRLGRLRIRITQTLAGLPGANPAYQPGDNCEQRGHFIHTFEDEGEIRTEFTGAGAGIRAVDWKRGFAVLVAPPVPGTGLQEPVPTFQAESS